MAQGGKPRNDIYARLGIVHRCIYTYIGVYTHRLTIPSSALIHVFCILYSFLVSYTLTDRHQLQGHPFGRV